MIKCSKKPRTWRDIELRCGLVAWDLEDKITAHFKIPSGTFDDCQQIIALRNQGIVSALADADVS